MNRNAFLLATGALIATTKAAGAAETALGAPTPYGTPTRAWVEQPTLIRQQCAEWCWAASAAMIFAAYGHPIDQKVIVDKLFGGVVCQPSGNTLNIARVLSDQWTDNNGDTFTSHIVAAYDYANGIYAINNAIIVNELANDHPLLYCNTHHAMVNVSAEYLATPYGPSQVTQVGVLDPWPYSPGYHLLSAVETVPANAGGQMTFLATVRIT